MSHKAPSLQQALPTEIITLIFFHIDDDVFLWVACRQLSRKMRAEVDFLFRTIQPKETIIYWPHNGLITERPMLAHLKFSHTSGDGTSAYFKVTIDEVTKKMGRAPTGEQTNHSLGLLQLCNCSIDLRENYGHANE